MKVNKISLISKDIFFNEMLKRKSGAFKNKKRDKKRDRKKFKNILKKYLTDNKFYDI